MIFIKIKREDLPRLELLSKYSGFNSKDSYTDNLPDRQDYVRYVAFYDLHFSYRDQRKIKGSIKKMGGKDITITSLGQGPILDKDTRKMLIDCSLMGAVAFTSGSGSVIGLSGNLAQGLVVGIITAASTFLIDLLLVRSRSKN
jgi:hypothetical protein